jgi:hypothetical protein
MSQEGARHAVAQHEQMCSGLFGSVACPCVPHGLVMALVCEECHGVVYLLLRRSAWCEHADDLHRRTLAPVLRWWS